MKQKLSYLCFWLYRCLTRTLYSVCCLGRIRNRRIFVNSFNGHSFADNPKYILASLNESGVSFEAIWLYRKKKPKETVLPFPVKFVRAYSIRAMYYQATSKIWIASVRMPFYSKKKKRQYYIQTWHGGVGIKKVEQACETVLLKRVVETGRRDSKIIDFYISNSQFLSDVYLNDFWYAGGEILEYGSPRNDCLFGVTEERIRRVKEPYHIEDKHVCLYAPTFRHDLSTEYYLSDFDRLRDALTRKYGGDWVIALRLHPAYASRMKTENVDKPYMIDLTSAGDIQEFLPAVDFLITDYSSIIFDYLLLGRPCAAYATDIANYAMDRSFYFPLSECPFPVAETVEGLDQAILSFDEDVYRKEREAFLNRVRCIDDGHASQRTAELVCRLMEDQTHR